MIGRLRSLMTFLRIQKTNKQIIGKIPTSQSDCLALLTIAKVSGTKNIERKDKIGPTASIGLESASYMQTKSMMQAWVLKSPSVNLANTLTNILD